MTEEIGSISSSPIHSRINGWNRQSSAIEHQPEISIYKKSVFFNS